MGYVFKGKNQDGEPTLFLVRCPECESENWAPAVATGKCCWCGYKARVSDTTEEK